MSLRMPLVQIILLIVGLLACSILPVAGLAAVLAEVRVQLLMILGVAVLYLGLLLRQGPRQLAPVVADDSWIDHAIHEREHGA